MSERSRTAIKACADWLVQCLEIGWPKSALDELEEIWWKFHDANGQLIEGSAPQVAKVYVWGLILDREPYDGT